MQVDLLIHSAAQLVTCASPGGSKRGAAMQDVGLIEDGAIAISDGNIVAVGQSNEIRNTCDARRTIDAAGKLLCPGFVDPHTHAVFAGDRANEFELRIKGASYLDILAAGGGILNTMRATRQTSLDHLVQQARKRLDEMLALGTTTVEIKTGYGLDTVTEIKMLRVIEQLAQTHPCDVLLTLLAAHAVPPEFQSDPNGYVDLVVDEIIPQAAEWFEREARANHASPMSCDVFCESHAFDLAQSRRVLLAGKQYGMHLKIHADQFTSLGGVAMAIELGALSVDHLDVTTSEDTLNLAHSNTIGVVLPAVNFNFGSAHFADARGMIDAGAAIALATDLNPGSAPCPSMQLVMAMACRYQKLTPAEALNASTINPAHALGIGAGLGSLEIGKQADLLIVDAPDYRHLAYQFGGNLVQTVIKRGHIVISQP